MLEIEVAGARLALLAQRQVQVLGGRAHERLRLPCFHFGEAVGVLPAFGAFTGMHALRPQPGERIFVVGDEAVQPLPQPTLAA